MLQCYLISTESLTNTLILKAECFLSCTWISAGLSQLSLAADSFLSLLTNSFAVHSNQNKLRWTCNAGLISCFLFTSAHARHTSQLFSNFSLFFIWTTEARGIGRTIMYLGFLRINLCYILWGNAQIRIYPDLDLWYLYRRDTNPPKDGPHN